MTKSRPYRDSVVRRVKMCLSLTPFLERPSFGNIFHFSTFPTNETPNLNEDPRYSFWRHSMKLKWDSKGVKDIRWVQTFVGSLLGVRTNLERSFFVVILTSEVNKSTRYSMSIPKVKVSPSFICHRNDS